MEVLEYNAICNLGAGIDEVFSKALAGDTSCFIEKDGRRLGAVLSNLPEIKNEDFNTRSNRLALAAIEPLGIEKYDKNSLAVVCATTNSGVEEYELTHNSAHYQIGNLAVFIKEYFNLKNYCTSVSTACSSGIKAFAIARELLENDFASHVLVFGTDSLSKVPIYGFDSLEILSSAPSNPFSINRNGINIGEGAAAFIVSKNGGNICISGIGETTDYYHSTTPDPEGIEAERAIRLALNGKTSVDYINLHGTGTKANDLMEGNAVYRIFGGSTPASSTKPLTGHCLGAAASIETALCCKLLENGGHKVFPHIYDGVYDNDIPLIKLACNNTVVKELKTCLCTSFGFGGTNTAMVLESKGE